MCIFVINFFLKKEKSKTTTRKEQRGTYWYVISATRVGMKTYINKNPTNDNES